MDQPIIRKLVVMIEETRREIGREVSPPLRKALAAAVIENPFAGRYAEDLTPLVSAGAFLGKLLAEQAVSALGGRGPVHSYGKGAIVGMRGEIEHAAALLHPSLGKPVREVVGHGAAIMPSASKRAGPGASLDVPLHFKDDEWSFDHFDAMALSLADAPAEDEIVVAVAVTNRGRPLARIGRPS
jgi:Amino acid synthesis